jgi:hypothetical protein
MVQKLKPIADITINYKDGSCEKMNYYALIGVTEDTWYKIMLSPPGVTDRVKMNNMLAELSTNLLDSVVKEKAAG